MVLHALDELPGFDVLMLLQPTSPLRTAADIDAACALFERQAAPSCVSVSPVVQSPYWMYSVDAQQGLSPLLPLPEGITRRQDLPPVVALNGAIYVADIHWLRQQRSFVGPGTVAYTMPVERSLDIDTEADWREVERCLAGV